MVVGRGWLGGGVDSRRPVLHGKRRKTVGHDKSPSGLASRGWPPSLVSGRPTAIGDRLTADRSRSTATVLQVGAVLKDRPLGKQKKVLSLKDGAALRAVLWVGLVQCGWVWVLVTMAGRENLQLTGHTQHGAHGRAPTPVGA